MAIALSALSACSTAPTHFVESDVPVPVGMTVRYSTDLKREQGVLSSGWFILWGNITDVNKTANGTVTRFEEDGWRLVEKSISAKRAALTFAKDSRTTRIDIDARRIDPGSSSATVRVSAEPTAPAATQG